MVASQLRGSWTILRNSGFSRRLPAASSRRRRTFTWEPPAGPMRTGKDALSRGPPFRFEARRVRKRFATVEIDSDLLRHPAPLDRTELARGSARWVPFAAKFPKEITHDRNLVGAEAEAENFLHTMAELGDRLGPLLLQLPPSFDVEGMGVLEDFLKRLPEGFRYAVEVRHRSWLGSDLPEMRERGAP